MSTRYPRFSHRALQISSHVGLLLGVLAFSPSEATAQTFLYHPMPAGTVVNILTATSLNNGMTDHEMFVADPFGSGAPPGMTPEPNRYGANLNHRIRIVGNPNVRTVSLRFRTFDLNGPIIGGVQDSFRLGWVGTTTGEILRTGFFGNLGMGTGPDVLTMTLTPGSGTTSNSLMFPGSHMTFRTGPAWDGNGAYVESEDEGFWIRSIDFSGNGTPGTQVVSMLVPHERVLGVLIGGGVSGGDTVDFRLPSHPTARYTVQLWLDNPNTGDVSLFARCGSLPVATAFDASSNTAPEISWPGWSGANLDLPACAGDWFITVTSTSPNNHLFHLVWGVHASDHRLSGVRVGAAPTASSTSDLWWLRRTMQEAAWWFHAITGGVWVIQSYTLFPSVGCDTPSEPTACGGEPCDFCAVNAVSGPGCRSVYNPAIGEVNLCRDVWGGTGAPRPWVITHEMGHSIIGLGDEYADTACWGGRSISTCGPSMMGGYDINVRSFCTWLNHRTSLDDWGALAGTPAYPPFAPNWNNDDARDCGGNWFWTNWAPAWEHINVHHAIFDMPMTISAHNNTLFQFRADQRFGWFTN